jgi:queuine tRNA-ribosyltransferase
LRHLLKAEEILGLRLVTLHNLHFYLHLMEQARAAIVGGSFAKFRKEFVDGYRVHESAASEGQKMASSDGHPTRARR